MLSIQLNVSFPKTPPPRVKEYLRQCKIILNGGRLRNVHRSPLPQENTTTGYPQSQFIMMEMSWKNLYILAADDESNA